MKPATPSKKRASAAGAKKRSAATSRSGGSRSKKRSSATAGEAAAAADESNVSYNLRQRDATKPKKYIDDEWEVDDPAGIEQDDVGDEVELEETTAAAADDDDDRAASKSPPPPRPPRRRAPLGAVVRPSLRTKEQQALLPQHLKDSLKRLKNLLKLPKARRWAFCEYFLADLDRPLLKPDEEFLHCLRESFPDLRTHELRRSEWRQVRRLIGKPRRYSAAFLEYERDDLERKRNRIRDIQKGAAAITLADDVDTPFRISRPLVVGARVFARVRTPKDGIFRGTVDAVIDERYRIVFDNDAVTPLVAPDSDIMSEAPDDMVPVSYFFEKNKASQLPAYRTNFLLTCEKLLSSEVAWLMQEQQQAGGGSGSTGGPPDDPHHHGAAETAGGKQRGAGAGGGGEDAAAAAAATSVREERCGNYPLRMIVMLVKLSKLLEKKKTLLGLLREMNFEGERHQMRVDMFSKDFQERYAEVVVELEQLNKQVDAYLAGVGEYVGTLLPHLTEVAVTSRPDVLQKFCQMHASQIVKHTNITMANVESKKTLDFITALTSMMLQIRALGQQNCNAYELKSLKESLDEIKTRLDPENRSLFENRVEINVKHIEMIMRGWRGPNAAAPAPASAADDSAADEAEAEAAADDDEPSNSSNNDE